MVDVGDDADATGFVGEGGGGLDFGKHRTGFEIALFDILGEFFDFDAMDGCGFGSAEINVGIRNGSD